MQENEKFYYVKKLAMCLGLISVILSIEHIVIPAMIVSAITFVLGGGLLYQEKKSHIKVNSNLALWSMLLGLAMFLSVLLFDILHI